MAALTQARMNVDEYLGWAEGRPGRYELYEGVVYARAPQRVIHAEIKLAVHLALVAAIREGRLPCHMLPDGMTVRIDSATAYEPDASVYCGAKLPRSALEVINPVIVVEVLSPSTQHIDSGVKLPGYSLLPSIMHYPSSTPIGRSSFTTPAPLTIQFSRASCARARSRSIRLELFSRSRTSTRAGEAAEELLEL